MAEKFRGERRVKISRWKIFTVQFTMKLRIRRENNNKISFYVSFAPSNIDNFGL